MLSVRSVLDGPGQGALERHDKVDERPSDDDVVVGDDAEGGQDGRQTDSRQSRVDASEDTDITALKLLTERELHECHRDTDGQQADPVRDEEENATPFVAEVREPPEVTEADAVADHSKDEGRATQPPCTFSVSAIVSERFDEAVFAAHVCVCMICFS